jgi:hypothetical protein
VIGMIMVWAVATFFGGYDYSPLISAIFLLGQLLSFLRWMVVELMLVAAGGDFVKAVGTIVPSILALVLAYGADRILWKMAGRRWSPSKLD